MVPVLALLVLAQSSATIAVARNPSLLAYCAPGVADNLSTTAEAAATLPPPTLMTNLQKRRNLVNYNSVMLAVSIGVLITGTLSVLMLGTIVPPMLKNYEFWRGVLNM